VRDESSGAVIANTPSSDFPLIRLEKDWLLVEPSADTFYRYNSEHVMTPFIARTPPVRSMTPEVFLLPSVITDRYYFMDAVKKEWNFETHDGFPRTLLVYDRVEGAIYESVVYNGDYSGKEKTPLYSKPMSEDIAFSGLLEAGELVEDYNEGRLKGRLAEIAAELDEESNPVVMFVKHRRAS
jgi:hypothetical protein